MAGEFNLSLIIDADGNVAVSEIKKVDDAIRSAGDAAEQSGQRARKGAAGTREHTNALKEQERAAKSTKMATIQLGMQIQDLGTQVASGTNFGKAFAMQVGQIGWAMSSMKGTAGAVGTFLSGPWGAAIAIASSFVGGLIGKLWEADDATKELTKSKQFNKLATEDLIGAVDKEQDALRSRIQLGREAVEQQQREAESLKGTIESRIDSTKALIAENRQLAEQLMLGAQSGGEGAEGAGIVAYFASRRADRAEQQLNTLEMQLMSQRGLQSRLGFNQAQEESLARVDPKKAIELRYQRGLQQLAETYEGLARIGMAGAGVEKERNAQLDKLNRAHEAELKEYQDAHKTGAGGLPRVTLDEARRIALQELGVTPTSGLRSAEHNRAVGGAPNSYHVAGQALDLPLAPGLTREKIQAAYQAAGIKLLELLGPGDRGHSDHFHIAFARQRMGPDQIARQDDAAQRRADELANFGQAAAGRIQGLAARFTPAPTVIEQTHAALAQLDQIVAEINQKKPPNLKELLADATVARGAIEQGVNQPWNDFVKGQERSSELNAQLLAGHEAEAEALQIIWAMQDKIGKLQPAQVAAVRASVAARRQEAAAIERVHARQQQQLAELNAYKEAFRGLFDPGGIKQFLPRIRQAMQQQIGDRLFEATIGTVFKKEEDRIKGLTEIDNASSKAAVAMDTATAEVNKLAQAAGNASAALGGEGPATAPDAGADGQVITVTGKRIPRDPAAILTRVLTGLGEKIFPPEIAKKIGATIAQGIEGAAIGSTVGGIVFGQNASKGQQLGSQVGGAIGQIAGQTFGKFLGSAAGPIGAVAGSLLGGLIGGALFGKKKVKAGSSENISDVTSRVGTSGAFSSEVGGLASNVQGGLSGIADQLGASIGDFSVSIGRRDKKYIVDTTGAGRTKGAGTPSYKTAEEAVGAAIADAIADGALRGISPAVQKALAKYGDDLDRALREAVKVQEVEELLGGLGTEVEKTFRDLERQIGERVRIAKEYGFDLVKLEEINAKERADTFDRIIKERVGALSDFLDSLKWGDLFEGTVAERRSALLSQIQQTSADASAGKEGAAGTLADQMRQLVELTREGYGTAGPEFASDLAATRANAEKIIQQESDRARQAQENAIAQLNATTTTAQLMDEQNNILTQQTTILERISAQLAIQQLAGNSAYDPATFRSVDLTA